jgi:DNA-binding MarR family transcriptional regulator
MTCDHSNEYRDDIMREHLTKHLKLMTNGADIKGLELSSLIRMLANYYAAIVTHKKVPGELSGPRMGILIRLLVAEKTGHTDGINPTTLSHFQNVKKNTISSLLRGLEESGYIERNLDPDDKRVFLIRITEKGRKMMETVGPERLKTMNDLASDLSDEEKTQLIFLLSKLRQSMQNHIDFQLNVEPETPEDPKKLFWNQRF